VPASALTGAWSTPDPDTGEIVPVAEEAKPMPYTIRHKKKRKTRGEPSGIGGDDIPFDP
jgi:hypothetical protein